MGLDQSLPLLPLGDEEPSFRLLEEDGDNHLLNFFCQNDELATVTTNMLMMVFDDTDDEKEDSSGTAKKKRKKRRVASYIGEDGIHHVLLPRMTYWYATYIDEPDIENPSFQKQFRLHFRLPYAQFLELSELMEESGCFLHWKDGNRDAYGKDSTPLRLLLLCSLCYLDRGFTFDDLSENTAITEEVIRVFFHSFIDFGSTVLFDKYVQVPSTALEATNHSWEFVAAGLNGAIGSTDATHIKLERVPMRQKQAHLGFKMSHMARTYNMTVNHRRRILLTTFGHPARWNDKTIAHFDYFMKGIQGGHIFQDYKFELYDYDDAGNVIRQKYEGVWLLVDNGYLNWPTTVPPFERSTNRAEIRFSSWLESMRKDVECTFGILKGRWRILKTGIRLKGVDVADKIWKTCCALHNWLLEIDGLDKCWEQGVASDWE